MEDLKKIINQIIDARINSGETQESFARKIGMKKSNLSRIESGKENITFDTLLKMIQSFTFHVNLRMDKVDENCDIYVLKQYDYSLLSFSFVKEDLEGYKVKIHEINEDLRYLLPHGLELSDDGLLFFLQKRSIPKNRANVDKILASQGLRSDDLKGIIDTCFGLSLNDCYWITKENFTGRFQDYNLYQNDFSNLLAYLAYTGVGSSHIVITTSPEFTTLGMLPKAWRKIDNKQYLYKGSTSGFANSGQEAYAEYYASQILGHLKLNHVKYDLEMWKGILASTCENFTNLDVSYIPIGRIVKTGGIKAVLEFYKELSDKDYEFIKSMLTFDCLIYNEDRHFGNFGVLIDNKTNKILGAAPIFDNGNSLFHYGMKNDIENLENYAKTRSNPYGISFDELAKNVIGDKQIQLLRKIQSFKFIKHSKYNWPENRLLKIEQFIKRRAEILIKSYKKTPINQ